MASVSVEQEVNVSQVSENILVFSGESTSGLRVFNCHRTAGWGGLGVGGGGGVGNDHLRCLHQLKPTHFSS